MNDTHLILSYSDNERIDIVSFEPMYHTVRDRFEILKSNVQIETPIGVYAVNIYYNPMSIESCDPKYNAVNVLATMFAPTPVYHNLAVARCVDCVTECGFSYEEATAIKQAFEYFLSQQDIIGIHDMYDKHYQ